MLRDAVDDGDPVKVATLCVLLHKRGERITPQAAVPAPDMQLAA